MSAGEYPFERKFIRYSVNLESVDGEKQARRGDLLAPYTAWTQLDAPFWQQLQENLREADSPLRLAITEKKLGESIFDITNEVSSLFMPMHERANMLADLRAKGYLAEALTDKERYIADHLAGRKLLLKEVLAAIPETNTTNFFVTLQKLYLQGFFDWQAAIAIGGQRLPYCQRCGYAKQNKQGSLFSRFQRLFLEEERVIPMACGSCGQSNCYYCPHCLEMGKVTACEPLLYWKGSTNIPCPKQVSFQWQGELSPAQEEASEQLFRFVHATARDVTSNDFLIWAVCGAGKTELLFQTIYQSLLKQEKILITSPRRDVILELAPRLQAAFPKTMIRVLHAESKEKFSAGELFLATAHQCLRFHRFFDLVIIDEEDAFPFHHDPMLAYAVQQARKPKAPTVYLTATPRQEMIRQVELGKLNYALIAKRYHGQPLAVPIIQPIGKWRKQINKRIILTPIVQYLQHLVRTERFGYLFVPHVRDLAFVEAYLHDVILPYLVNQSHLTTTESASFTIETVHAEHPERTTIVQRFRHHQIKLLLTTTILERGVTIPYSDVAVLGSDDPIFDTAALIQIAGRVGRKWEDPIGHVWFFPEARTSAQQAAIQQIKEWNRR